MDMNIGGSLTQVLLIEDSSQIGHARRTAQKLAEDNGFDATDAGRVALVATELASNVLKHAARGELHLRILPGSSANTCRQSGSCVSIRTFILVKKVN